MASPRNAFGASPPPCRGACRARGHRQRTGQAGSAAVAWLRRGAISLFLLSLPAYAAPPLPAIAKAKAGTQCVAPPEVMRRDHPRMLKHQRDDTVRGGVRGAQASLKGCIECHASPETGSVAAAPQDFCSSCHHYAAVKLDCFECHSTRPAAAVARRP